MFDYALLTKQAAALIDGESDVIASLANISALINDNLDNLNWVGFYMAQGDELVLGPFQGKVACFRIPMGKGVCGTAAATGEIQRIADVHQFPGHIACDAASESELVIPVYRQGQLLAVLDIDSPILDRFSAADAEGLAGLVKALEQHLDATAPGAA